MKDDPGTDKQSRISTFVGTQVQTILHNTHKAAAVASGVERRADQRRESADRRRARRPTTDRRLSIADRRQLA